MSQKTKRALKKHKKYNRDSQRLATMRDLMRKIETPKQTIEKAVFHMMQRSKMSPGKMNHKFLRMHPRP